jgi:hypothetical protein
MFRNSIPPVRPYNPPPFEDIFETDHAKDSSSMNLQRVNPLKKFGLEQNQQQNVLKCANKYVDFGERK